MSCVCVDHACVKASSSNNVLPVFCLDNCYKIKSLNKQLTIGVFPSELDDSDNVFLLYNAPSGIALIEVEDTPYPFVFPMHYEILTRDTVIVTNINTRYDPKIIKTETLETRLKREDLEKLIKQLEKIYKNINIVDLTRLAKTKHAKKNKIIFKVKSIDHGIMKIKLEKEK